MQTPGRGILFFLLSIQISWPCCCPGSSGGAGLWLLSSWGWESVCAMGSSIPPHPILTPLGPSWCRDRTGDPAGMSQPCLLTPEAELVCSVAGKALERSSYPCWSSLSISLGSCLHCCSFCIPCQEFIYGWDSICIAQCINRL